MKLFPNDVANLSIPNITAIPMDGGVLLFVVAITLLTAVLFESRCAARMLEGGTAVKESARGPRQAARFHEWGPEPPECFARREFAGGDDLPALSGFWATEGFLLRRQAPPENGQSAEADNRLITRNYVGLGVRDAGAAARLHRHLWRDVLCGDAAHQRDRVGMALRRADVLRVDSKAILQRSAEPLAPQYNE